MTPVKNFLDKVLIDQLFTEKKREDFKCEKPTEKRIIELRDFLELSFFIRRGDFETITSLIKKFNPKAFYTLEDVKFVSEGIFPIKKASLTKTLYFPPFKYWRKGK